MDSQGGILATQEVSGLDSDVSVRDIGLIASVEIAELRFPSDLVISEIRSSRPQIIHDSALNLTHPALFQNATRGTDFETEPDGGFVGALVFNQWQSIGVVVSDENGESALLRTSPHLPDWSIFDLVDRPRSGSNGVFSATETLVITFVDPRTGESSVVREAGLWVMNMFVFGLGYPTTVQFLDTDGQVLETTTSSGKYFFAGARSKRGIARIVLTDPDGFLVDDLQFSPVRRLNTHSPGEEEFHRGTPRFQQRGIFLF